MEPLLPEGEGGAKQRDDSARELSPDVSSVRRLECSTRCDTVVESFVITRSQNHDETRQTLAILIENPADDHIKGQHTSDYATSKCLVSSYPDGLWMRHLKLSQRPNMPSGYRQHRHSVTL